MAIKILAVCHDPSLYGAQRSLLDLVLGLPKDKFAISVCSPRPGGVTEACISPGIPVFVLPHRLWIPPNNMVRRGYFLRYLFGFPWAVIKTWVFLEKNKFDVVYTNTVTVLEYAVAAKLAGVPHVWHLREGVAKNTQLRPPLPAAVVGKVVHSLSTRVVFNSSYLLRQYREVSAEKAIVVYNGISGSYFGRGNDISGQCSRGSDILRLVTIGYMDRRKGLDVLLDALLLIGAASLESIRLTVVGEFDDSYWRLEISPRLEHEVLGKVVSCIGWSSEVSGLLAKHDVLVSSAREEPFGRTVVEAMFGGLAVIATQSGGPEEIVVDGVTGVLVATEDPAALAQAITRFIADRSLVDKMGEKGRRRACERFSVARYVNDMGQIFEECISYP